MVAVFAAVPGLIGHTDVRVVVLVLCRGAVFQWGCMVVAKLIVVS